MKKAIIHFSVLLLFLLVRLSPVYAGLEEGWATAERGDYETALQEFKPLAEQGNKWAQSQLGIMYLHGKGVPQDYAEAFKWLKKAAEQGNVVAQQYLGVMYHNGEGVPQDYAEAFKWFRKAAEQGDARSQYGIGKLYSAGKGVPQDYSEAAKWMRKAAEKGDADVLPNSSLIPDQASLIFVSEQRGRYCGGYSVGDFLNVILQIVLLNRLA